jgi:hypothetical protein
MVSFVHTVAQFAAGAPVPARTPRSSSICSPQQKTAALATTTMMPTIDRIAGATTAIHVINKKKPGVISTGLLFGRADRTVGNLK